MAVSIDLKLEGDGAFADWQGRQIMHLGNGSSIRIAVLERGMSSGLPSLAIGIDLRGFDGRTGDALLIETSARLFVTVAEAIKAKFPGLME